MSNTAHLRRQQSRAIWHVLGALLDSSAPRLDAGNHALSRLVRITDWPPYFAVCDAFVIVLMSVGKINFMITHDDRNLGGNPIFLICIGFIIHFIYEIIREWAYQMSLQGATETTTRIIVGFSYVDVLVNIIFAIALLRIPRPQKFTLK